MVQAITDKLIRRHPHVFQADQISALNAEEVAELWQQIKQQEKQGKPQSRLADIKHAPALTQADEIQKNVAKIGFDFPDLQGAYGKLEEELAEFRAAVAGQNSDEIFDNLVIGIHRLERRIGR